LTLRSAARHVRGEVPTRGVVMRSTWVRTALWAAVLLFGGSRRGNPAQAVPWDIFEDLDSTSVCDTVNAANVELVVLSDSGQLVIITGADLVLDASFVDADGFVFFDGLPVGVIDFADDGDGFRTLWWTSLSGTVVEVDEFTGEPFATALFPFDFVDVSCDACELWDDPADCVTDSDLDGVPEEIDLCPDTPLGELIDLDGCACFEVDSDGDGVDDCDDECPLDFGDDPFGCPCEEFDDDLDGVDNCFDLCPDTPLNTVVTEEGCPCNEFDEDDDGINDCFDDCPNTPLGADVDADGCAIVIVVEPPPVFVVCGNFSTLTMALTFGTLVTLRMTRRRYS